jgi:hypothetical protein
MFSGMAGILIRLIKRMKRKDPATGERFPAMGKASLLQHPV